MLLSEVLREMGDHDSVVLQEKPFQTMGMLIKGYSSAERCVFVLDPAYIRKVDDTISVVITFKDLAEEILQLNKCVCISDSPRIKFYQIHNFLAEKEGYRRKKFQTTAADRSNISPLSSIAKNNVKIGRNVTIENFVDIKENVTIEDHVVIRSGAVIGNPGFDYKEIDGRIIMTAQSGGIIIKKGAEVGSNSCIERAAFPQEDTIIGEDSKIGSLCYISHGVIVGRRVFMPNCVSISGYTRIDDRVSIGPNAAVTNVAHIGADTKVTIGAVVGSNIKKGAHVTGNFAIPHKKFLQNYMDNLRK